MGGPHYIMKPREKKKNNLSNKIVILTTGMSMLQYHWNIEYSLSVHLFYGLFYLLTFSCWMVTNVHIYTYTVQQLKDAGSFKFVWCFGTTCQGLIRSMSMATLQVLWEKASSLLGATLKLILEWKPSGQCFS